MTLLRHPGSGGPDAPKTGNHQYLDSSLVGNLPSRSCLKGSHRASPVGGKVLRFWGWTCAGCLPVKVAP